MQLTLIVSVDSEDEPQEVVNEVVSALEFDHRTTVKKAVAIEDDSNEAYRYGEMKMTVKITTNDAGSSPGKLADVELHFNDGPFEGLKLIGFAVWESRAKSGRNVTFPARQYSVNGERRSFALLRPIADLSGQNRVRDLVLEAYSQHEAASA